MHNSSYCIVMKKYEGDVSQLIKLEGGKLEVAWVQCIQGKIEVNIMGAMHRDRMHVGMSHAQMAHVPVPQYECLMHVLYCMAGSCREGCNAQR